MTEHKTVSHDGPLFDAMMREIDGRLSREGYSIEDRPIAATREVSVLHGVPIPIGGVDPERMPPELAAHAPLGAAITGWYDETYGERLKVDMKPGRTVVRLDGDLYALSIPRVFGGVAFGVSRVFLPKRTSLAAPAECNIIELVEHMTPTKAAQLSDDDLRAAERAFITALWASYTLEATPHPLMDSARADVATAVTALMHRGGRFGESKWASLQAAEKTLKAAIALQGETFPYSHNLTKLAARLIEVGVHVTVQPLVDAIQCTPGIRYGDEACSEAEAVAAHQASLELVNTLREAGAKFQAGIG